VSFRGIESQSIARPFLPCGHGHAERSHATCKSTGQPKKHSPLQAISRATSQNWPLGAGLYQAVLSGGVRPYSAHAVSERFEIGCIDTPQSDADSVAVDKTCYQLNEGIRVNFKRDFGSNFVEKWVAIYRQENLGGNLENLSSSPSMWTRACGSQSCDTQNIGPANGAVTFQDNAHENWPLGAGLYQTVLSGGDKPYSAHAVSERFEIGCNGTLVLQPTSGPATPLPGTDGMAAVIQQARTDIECLIQFNQLLISKFQ
jgi:hypothetical protein